MRGHLLAFLKFYTTTNYRRTRDNNRALKLENRLGESPRGFESLRLRQKKDKLLLVLFCLKGYFEKPH